ncbi:MAG: recombination mediator RecR [Gammaproteobacteria bacterium]|uniref:Recombination protein RecR n=1 Tax=SAR86 cluster bacterium TaxID=2030880 RepID=A0A520N005_9GAMM|nr:recombination protein RecR [Gammaproteobacteria bacterium]MBA4729860.1 recombination protein RecR [SAR86 cluster bacterium]RZO26801.1 MAG: recombination protein RecR [SAR86 cluster bacterium]|tara:strand:- start:1186 stop:1788 length:603 start_codon:yes stop_codon:yes gene_type:complete
MKNEDSLLTNLISSLKILPGVGEKTAQRMAFHLLEKNREGAKKLSTLIDKSISEIKNCEVCRDLTEDKICRICADDRRDIGLLCVVENPSDILAIEKSGSFKGRYFVLMGRLSPIDGIGPDELGIPKLIELLETSNVKELIIATSPTIEGDATSFYIKDQIQNDRVLVTRIAYGVPMGGELEYVDNTTLGRAISGRRQIS